MNFKSEKAFRLMYLSDKLSRGEFIFKSKIQNEFGITPKTFQRDIDSLRQYYLEQGIGDIVYDRKHGHYSLDSKSEKLTRKEIFTLCKILVESRALNKSEFNDIVDKLLHQCDINESKEVQKLIANERVNYIQLQHGKPLVKRLWELAEITDKKYVIKITYKRLDGTERQHDVKPVGIMFSEFYFYLIAYMADESKDFPTVFRIDRISNMEYTEQKFDYPYAKRFSEADFRKRVQFMYAGKLQTIRFLYKGNPEAVLDRLPTAQIEKNTPEGLIIKAEIYGEGINMWIRSQGENIMLL